MTNSQETTVDMIKDWDNKGLISRDLESPPKKDTVAVPSAGYAVLRFKAENPGKIKNQIHILVIFFISICTIRTLF